MITIENITTYWQWLNKYFDKKAIAQAVEEFCFDTRRLQPGNLRNLNANERFVLMDDLILMTMGGLGVGDFEQMHDFLLHNISLSEEDIDDLLDA